MPRAAPWALPRYNAKMEARSAPQSRLRAAEPRLATAAAAVRFCAVLCCALELQLVPRQVMNIRWAPGLAP